MVVAYAEEAHFLTEKGKVLKGQQQMANDTLEFVVEQLDPGTYALVVFEDLNENGLLDRNKLVYHKSHLVSLRLKWVFLVRLHSRSLFRISARKRY